MEYITVEIKVPSTLTAEELKEWAMIKVERHLRSFKQAEIKALEDSVEADLSLVKAENGIIKEEI